MSNAVEKGVAHELIAVLNRNPVVLVRHDATWKYAFVASAMTFPVNYFLLARTGCPLLTLALTAIVVGLAAFFGRQNVAYVCSDPNCRAINDSENEWCAKCGAKIEAVVERPGLLR